MLSCRMVEVLLPGSTWLGISEDWKKCQRLGQGISRMVIYTQQVGATEL